MGSKKGGLLALLGLGALAWWKYNTSSDEEKQMVKDKVNNAKDNLNKWGSDIKSKASDVASQVQDKAKDYSNKAENKIEEVKSDAQNAM